MLAYDNGCDGVGTAQVSGNGDVVFSVLGYCVECPYNLGFFLGPGLPRSRGGAFGSMDGGARFLPLTAPPPLFRLPSTLGGGASELGSCSSLTFDGMGVVFDSDDLSALSGGWTDGDGSSVMRGLTSAGNWASRSGERRSVTILLFLLDFEPPFAVGVVDDMVGDGVVDGLMRGWMVVDGGREVGRAETTPV